MLDRGSGGSCSMFWLLSRAFCSTAQSERGAGTAQRCLHSSLSVLTILNKEKLFTCSRGCFATVTSYRKVLKFGVLAETNDCLCLWLESLRTEDRSRSSLGPSVLKSALPNPNKSQFLQGTCTLLFQMVLGGTRSKRGSGIPGQVG